MTTEAMTFADEMTYIEQEATAILSDEAGQDYARVTWARNAMAALHPVRVADAAEAAA